MKKLIEDLFSGKNVVVITGAGISTASGIPDFRSNDGLYNNPNEEFYKKHPYLRGYPIEFMLSRTCLLRYPEAFYDFYKINKVLSNEIKPNINHNVLADLEKEGFITGIITQNIDNLHQEAGSENVITIHGTNDFYCTDCKTEYSKDHYLNEGYKCTCDGCKGNIRPAIVLYQEGYNMEDYYKCIDMINKADVVIAAGTSLTVSTVTRFIDLFIHGDDPDKHLYILNNQPTRYDTYTYGQRYDVDLPTAFGEIGKVLANKKAEKEKVKVKEKQDN